MATGISMPDERQLPPGPLRDLVAALHELYRQAGKPGTRLISNEVNKRHDLPDTISHEGASALLRGAGVGRWAKVESLVRVLAAQSVRKPDVEAEVQRIHALWLLASDGVRGTPLAAADRPWELWPFVAAAAAESELQTDVRESADGQVTIVVRGAIDMQGCSDLAQLLMKLKTVRQVLDLRGVTFLDSMGVSLLVGHHGRITQAGGSLRVLCSRPVFRILDVVGLTKPLRATEMAAEVGPPGSR